MNWQKEDVPSCIITNRSYYFDVYSKKQFKDCLLDFHQYVIENYDKADNENFYTSKLYPSFQYNIHTIYILWLDMEHHDK